MADDFKDLEQKIKITYDTNAEDVAGKVDKVADSTDNVIAKQKEQNKEQKEINNTIDNTGKSLKNAEEGTSKMSKGFKAVGLAIKAVGIFLVLDAFNLLKDLFSSNQKVADFFATSLKSLGIVFNDLFGFIEKSVGPITDYFKEFFENPQEKIEELGNLIKDNLIERFNSFLKTLGHVGSAIGKLFKGDFTGAAEEAGNAWKESIDVLTGVNNSVDRLTETISEYASEVWSAAEAMVDLENRTKIAIAQNQGLIEQYDRLAEQQRQIRDDESLSIDERINANNKLGEVLDEQRKKMLANADLIIQSAALEYKQNQSIENQIKLIEAQNEKKAILAQIEGFLSEQKVNQIALEKELNELNQTAIDGIASREIANKKFTNSAIKDTTDRLEAERDALDEEYNIELQRLETKKALYKEGTQAYTDANEEILNLQQQYNQSIAANEKTLTETLIAEQQLKNQSIIDNDKLLFEERFAALEEQRLLLNEQEFASEEERTIALEALSNKRIEIEQAEFDHKQAVQTASLDLASGGIALLKNLGEKNKGIQKAALIAENAVALAKVGIDTAKAVTSSVAASPTTGGMPFSGIAIGTGVISAANIVAATAKGLKALGGGSAGGGGGTTQRIGAASQPQTGFQASSENQIATSVTNAQRDTPPVQAYVVSQEVTTAQSIDRNRIEGNSF